MRKQRHTTTQRPLLSVVSSNPTNDDNNNNNNGHESDASSISFDNNGNGDYNDKKYGKNTTASILAIRRITLRFHMLPKVFQIIISLLIGSIVGYTIVTIVQHRNELYHSIFHGDAPPLGGDSKQRRRSIIQQQQQPSLSSSSLSFWGKQQQQISSQWSTHPRIVQVMTVSPLRNDNNNVEEDINNSNNNNRKKQIMKMKHPERIAMIVPLNHVTTRLSSLPISNINGTGRELVDRYVPLPHLADIPQLSAASELDRNGCHRLADWQADHKPTCNSLHEISGSFQEISITVPERIHEDEEEEDGSRIKQSIYKNFQMVAAGAFRQVWMIREYDGTLRALKTLRYSEKVKLDLRGFDRHRRDALSMDQLTSSPLIVNIYGYCINSGLFDWGEGGDLEAFIEKKKEEAASASAAEKNNNDDEEDDEEKENHHDGVVVEKEPIVSKDYLLQVAYNVSLSLAHAHHPDEKGRATLAHTDIKPNQFLYQDGYFKLTDFNRVRFLTWNDQKDESCGFKVGKNGGQWRSPEEYAYERETEKVDVYSLGNVLYYILTLGISPWEIEDISSKEIYQHVMDGKRPKLPKDIIASTNTYEQTMKDAIELCYIHDPKERPSAQQIANRIAVGLREMGIAVPSVRTRRRTTSTNHHPS